MTLSAYYLSLTFATLLSMCIILVFAGTCANLSLTFATFLSVCIMLNVCLSQSHIRNFFIRVYCIVFAGTSTLPPFSWSGEGGVHMGLPTVYDFPFVKISPREL